MSKSHKDISRQSWNLDNRESLTNDDIKIGCLQRIADATETMAKNYNQLFEEKEKFRKWYYEERAKRQHLERSITTYKGNYTRLKNKLEQQNG